MTVQREYYYNNAGNQMIKLGKSLKLRYLQQLGDEVELPAEYYQGEYLVKVAADLVAETWRIAARRKAGSSSKMPPKRACSIGSIARLHP